MPGYINEKKLSDFWRRQAWGERLLATENGIPVTVVYPGRLNDGRGGDYCDAVVTLGDHTVVGNIELHTKTSDWQAHGHHRDTHYNQVVLHVVYHNNRHPFTIRQDGIPIPVLSLEKTGITSSSGIAGKNVSPRPCHTTILRNRGKTIIDILTAAGDHRFNMKSDRFIAQLSHSDAGQVLYQGIMEGLGYLKNQDVFRNLAGILPLAALQSDAESPITDSEYLQRIYTRLLSEAGILPVESVMESAEKEIVTGYSNPSLYDWQMFRVRPVNSPVVRLAAMSCLLLRYRHCGLLAGLVRKVKDAPEGKDNRTLLESLTISVKEKSVSLLLTDTLSLLGQNRAGEIVVNILLPFTHAYGKLHHDPVLSMKAVSLYHRQGKTAGNNLERHMMEQIRLSPKVIDNARLQQGLLHIYRQFCSRGRCGECCLRQLKVGNHIQV